MTDSLKQRAGQKLNLVCPNDHILYKDGITAKRLYQKYGIRLQEKQCLAKPVDWEKARRDIERLMQREGYGPIEKVWTNKSLKLCPIYQMTEQNMKLWRDGCKLCKVAEDEKKKLEGEDVE